MVADKQLIIVVEGTATLGMHWPTILSGYLEKIVRVFCECESMKAHTSIEVRDNFELQLVMFATHGSYGSIRSGWTRHMDIFMDNLKSMQFLGGGPNDADTTNGLVDALMMFAIPSNGYKTEENLAGKRHCILVTATNPFPLPVPVYRPNFDDCGDRSPYNDAETVAGWFGRCSVSLSVICPRKLPKIRALYEAGKHNSNSEDPPVQNHHPGFLVLISEDFKEAQDALNLTMLTENQDAFSQSHPEARASTTYQPVELPVRKSHSSEKASSSLISKSSDVTGTSQHVKKSNVSSSSATKFETKASSLGLLQSSSNLQRNTTAVTGQIESSMNQVNAVQLEDGLGMNLVTTTDLSSTDVAYSTKIPVLGMPAVSMPVSQETHGCLPMEKSNYVIVWEGNLLSLRHGNAVFITRLEAYRHKSAPATLAADWPDSITVAGLMLQDTVNHKYNVGSAVRLIFKVVNKHLVIRNLFAKKLFAVVKLPNQILILDFTNKQTHIVGMLFPKDAQTSSASRPLSAATAAEFGAATAADDHQQR